MRARGRGYYPADEAVRVPLAVEGRYVVLHDGAVAAAALGGEHVEVVLAAVGLAVPLVEALLAELLAALGAEEVLRVPGLLQGGHAFLKQHEQGRGFLCGVFRDSRLWWVTFGLIIGWCIEIIVDYLKGRLSKHRSTGSTSRVPFFANNGAFTKMKRLKTNNYFRCKCWRSVQNSSD